MKKFILTAFVLGAHAYCDRANLNKIDMDPRVMNWSYVGPIKSAEVHDEMLNQILENGIGNDSIFVFDGKDYPIIDASASSDANFVAQVYKDIKEDDYLIGVARIFSNDDIEVAVNGWFYNTKSQLVYLNGEEIEKLREQSKVIFRKKVKKGENQLILSMKNFDQFGFGYYFHGENRVELTIKLVDEDDKPIPFAGFGLRGDDFFQTGGSTDMNGYAERVFQLRGDEKNFILFADGRDDRYASKILKNVKPGARLNYKLKLGKVPSIEGKVLSLDGKNPQPSTRVRANLISDDRDLPLEVTGAGMDGSYKFANLPFGKYELFVSFPDKDYYVNDKNGKRRIFDISPGKPNYLNADFKTPTPDRGRWENIDYLDGLLSNWVSDILIDDNNNIWFACWTGISIFNGIEMKSLTPKDGIPSKPINRLFKDSKGNVWAGASTSKSTDLGLVKIDPDMNITPYYYSEEIPIQDIAAIAEDEYGRLIFGGSAGLTILDGEDFTNYDYADGVGSGAVRAILVEGKNMWIGTQIGLVYYNGKKFRTYHYMDGLPANTINKIVKSPKGEIWIATQNGISIYDGMSFKNISLLKGLNRRPVFDIYFDDNGDILIATQRGISKLREDGTFYKLDPVRTGHDKVLTAIYDITKSKDGMYWFAGYNYGAWKYDPSSIRNLTENDSIPNAQKTKMIIDSDQTLWISTAGQGIFEIKNEKLQNIYNMEDGLRSNNVRDLSMDNYGNLWIATNRGISMFNGKIFKNYTESDGMPSENVGSITVDKNGTVWFITPKGLTSYDGGEFLTFDEEDGISLTSTNDPDVYASDDGSIVIAQSPAGVTIFKDGISKTLSKEDGLTDTRVQDIDFDSKNNIWIGTDGGGVFKYDGSKMEHFDVEDGLAHSETYDVYVDDNDKVWVGTFGAGVSFYDGEIWGSLDTRDGLIGNTINSIVSISDQKFFFGTYRGISQYTPSMNAGMVNISSVTTPQNKYYIDKDDTNVSTQTDFRVRFSFNAANYNTIQEKQKYRYRIIGHNENWSEPFKGNEVDWIPENRGEYEFQVQAIDRDLNYSPAQGVKFSVLLPWYWRLNYLAPILGFFSVIFYVVYTTTSRYVKQKEFNEKLRLQAQKKDQEARKVVEQKNKDLQESQKAAEAANEAKSTFLANMSHELRTPLNAIIGYSEMLIEDAEDENEDFIPDLDKINSSGKHLLGLINDILDLSKVESGKMELFIEEFDLEKILNEVAATITPLVEKNNNSLNLTINTETKSISADITKIRQILLNLLSNATKFTKEGKIDIIVEDNPENSSLLDFKVSDSGIGMTAEQVDKVFKPFTQADEKTTRKFGGTGLGLTITKMFAEMMGGGIDLSSIVNEGTTFIVSIPKFVIDPKKVKDKIDEVSSKTEDSSFTILVIDDDANAQELMKKFLIKENYNVLQATSGPTGLDLAAKHLPDLITLDVMMPEMDGWEVLAALQNNETTKNIPVIMLTMANEPDIGYSLGATDYLTKPVDWGRLSSILEKHEIETSSQSILIVEDDEITRDMLKKSLETNEFKVSVAKNGKEGLEKVKKAKPALILLDLMMPEMDGFEFAEELREKKEWLDIPVVVITAKDLTSDDHSRLKGNVEAIMQKGSYSRDELLSEVGQRIKKLKEEV